MKIPLHHVIEEKEKEELFDEISEELHSGCSYSGTDILKHDVEGECFDCDFEKIRSKEELAGVDWLDITESWDYYDYWHNLYGKKNV